MICNFMIFSESVGSGAYLSAGKRIVSPCKVMLCRDFFIGFDERNTSLLACGKELLS